MSLGDLTKDSVLLAVAECEELGRDAFLAKYGFGPSRRYFLIHDGVAYDSKAICGAAHGFLGEGAMPLGPADFSGGDKTVGATLTKLGFAVSASPYRLKVGGTDGGLLNAECELRRSSTGYVITLMSRGGKLGTPTERNPDYLSALRALVRRMASAGVVLEQAVLDTEQTRSLPVSERQLLGSTPIALSSASDVEDLVSQITQASSSFSKGKKGGGNPTKQIQLHISGAGLTTVESVRSGIINGAINMFVLTWNPAVWPMDDDIDDAIEATSAGEHVVGTWSTGNRKSGINSGDHVVLFRQGTEDRGLIAIGTAIGEIFQDAHFNNPDEAANYVEVAWTEWVPTDERLPVEELAAITTATNWNAILSSGIRLPDDDAIAVLNAWGAPGSGEGGVTGDEEVGQLPEGAKKTVTVNRYERSGRARRACLKKHGTACAVCEIDFGVAYGGIGKGFIHVHHITPISAVGQEYVLDPIADLVPVCPNCHAMLHHKVSQPRTVAELRKLLGK